MRHLDFVFLEFSNGCLVTRRMTADHFFKPALHCGILVYFFCPHSDWLITDISKLEKIHFLCVLMPNKAWKFFPYLIFGSSHRLE